MMKASKQNESHSKILSISESYNAFEKNTSQSNLSAKILPPPKPIEVEEDESTKNKSKKKN